MPRRMRLRLLHLLMQEEEEEERDAIVALVAHNCVEEERDHRRRRYWVRPWLQRRALFGQYDTLFQELDRESDGDYMSFIRMDRNLFAELLHRVAPRITKGPK